MLPMPTRAICELQGQGGSVRRQVNKGYKFGFAQVYSFFFNPPSCAMRKEVV